MWYVIQVQTGKENDQAVLCSQLLDQKILERSFVPIYEEMKRYCGKWHKEQRILFPGYVFLISDQADELFLQLKAVPGLTKLLSTGNTITPLSEEEIQLLLTWGQEEQIVKMSVGIMEQDRILILEGPLQGREGSIKRIDRHKRKAWVEIGMFGGVVDVEVGLEIVAKR